MTIDISKIFAGLSLFSKAGSKSSLGEREYIPTFAEDANR